ncbi:hypothetical protein L1987_02867 [Smallanthus sonchifolius]|uniref:Uncharacterized protein n=1 Tax=Smallanthus sonchifolius TaxID=185202 RepID=A0ACB9K913_9ASTR|nr:hypothetical protein L1987_02867 [Smallanthus sonchifolius]
MSHILQKERIPPLPLLLRLLQWIGYKSLSTKHWSLLSHTGTRSMDPNTMFHRLCGSNQITDAVVVARYLKATLVIPDIRGSRPDGVVKVVKTQPTELSTKDLVVLRIPNRVIEDYIANNIEPVFKTKGNVRLATYFPSVNTKKTRVPENEERNSVGCLAMFGTLELQQEVREVVNSIVDRLKTLSHNSDSYFFAIDLRLDMLEQKGCQGSKKCYGLAGFLKKLGFDKNSVVYLTQSRWDSNLDSLKGFFPEEIAGFLKGLIKTVMFI